MIDADCVLRWVDESLKIALPPTSESLEVWRFQSLEVWIFVGVKVWKFGSWAVYSETCLQFSKRPNLQTSKLSQTSKLPNFHTLELGFFF
jgi:hypothetical protein